MPIISINNKKLLNFNNKKTSEKDENKGKN